MIKNVDVDFLLGRVADELEFAATSPDPAAAHVHRQMAALYAGRLSDLRDRGMTVNAVPFMANH